MADKQVDGLDPKLSPIGADEVPVFDSAEAGPEKLKRVSYIHFHIPVWNPNANPPTGPGLVTMTQTTVNMYNFGAGGIHGYVSAADVIKSIIDDPDPPYQFGIWKVGDMPTLPGSGELDPRDAVLDLVCADPEVVIAEVGVMNNTGNWNFSEIIILKNDLSGFCAP